ncbi:MAG: AraC family ligand binding domain-containing protein [Chthoniobacteraceae bacterium]
MTEDHEFPSAILTRGEGFTGQRMSRLPPMVANQALKQELLGGLLPVEIGYFPHAHHHARERKPGIGEAILIYCTQGEGWCEINGRRSPVKPGDLVVIPPQLAHAYGAHEQKPWSIYWFHVQGRQLAAFLAELGSSTERPILPVGETPQIPALFEELLALLEPGYAPENLLGASHTLAHLMVVLIRQQRKAGYDQPGTRQRIAEAMDYMRQHLDQPLSLDHLTAMTHLSRSRLAELFKQQAGYSPIDYFIRQRMQRACQLLDLTKMSIKAIASALGYEDPLYFSRVFRKVNQMSPGKYRQTSQR